MKTYLLLGIMQIAFMQAFAQGNGHNLGRDRFAANNNAAKQENRTTTYGNNNRNQAQQQTNRTAEDRNKGKTVVDNRYHADRDHKVVVVQENHSAWKTNNDNRKQVNYDRNHVNYGNNHSYVRNYAPVAINTYHADKWHFNYSRIFRPVIHFDFVYNYNYQTDFDRLIQAINNQPYDDSKLIVAEEAMKYRSLTSEQTAEIMNRFNYETTRLDFAEYAYDHVVDVQNYYLVYNTFTYSSSVEDLDNYLNQHDDMGYGAE